MANAGVIGARVAALALIMAVATAACSPPAQTQAGDQPKTMVADTGACTLERTSEGRLAVLRGTCPRTATAVAAALRAGRDTLEGVTEISMGRVPFGTDGVFDRCDLMGRLARDPRWTDKIDSAAAQPLLTATLTAMQPAAAVREALGAPTVQAGVEMVILEPAGTDCPAAPSRAPVEALLWLVLGG